MQNWPHTPKMIASTWRVDVHLQAKNQLYPSSFSWDIVNKMQICYFEYSGHVWLHTPKVILSTCIKLSCLSADKKSASSPCFSEDIAKICKPLILGTLGMPGYEHPKW